MRHRLSLRSSWLVIALLLTTCLGPSLATGQSPEKPTPSNPPPRSLPATVAARANQLAATIDRHRRNGEFEAALAPARELAALRTEHQGPDHWQTQDALRAVETLRTIAALPEDGRRAMASFPAMMDQARVYYVKGQYDQAVALLRRLIELSVRWLGEDHPDTANSRNNLGAVLHAQGRYAEAEELARQALAARIAVLGEGHPHTAKAATIWPRSCGGLCPPRWRPGPISSRRRSTSTAATASLRRRWPRPRWRRCAPSIRDPTTGRRRMPFAVETLRTIAALPEDGRRAMASVPAMRVQASLYSRRGQYDQAAALLRRSIELSVRWLGENHTATSRNNLGKVLHLQGRYAEAEEQHRQALAV